jgi:RHS repeat-associated protein
VLKGQARIRATSTTTQYWYLWEGQNLLAEYNASDQRQKRYAYLLGSYLPEQMADSTGTYTVHSDHLQTPTVLSNSQGTTVWSMQHVAFGQAWINSDPDGDGIAVEFNQRFPGQYYDQETGLNYNYFRDYDPAIGRYIQSDPIGLAGGMNVYGYVSSSPVKFIDPLGLEGVYGLNGRSPYSQSNRIRNLSKVDLSKDLSKLANHSENLSNILVLSTPFVGPFAPLTATAATTLQVCAVGMRAGAGEFESAAKGAFLGILTEISSDFLAKKIKGPLELSTESFSAAKGMLSSPVALQGISSSFSESATQLSE